MFEIVIAFFKIIVTFFEIIQALVQASTLCSVRLSSATLREKKCELTMDWALQGLFYEAPKLRLTIGKLAIVATFIQNVVRRRRSLRRVIKTMYVL